MDISIPDLPKQVGQAATLGKPAAALRGPFQTAIKELSALLAGERTDTSAERTETARPKKSVVMNQKATKGGLGLFAKR